MKKAKPLVLVLCAVLLVAATILGTVAYLTDEEGVVNTFTIGQVDLRLDEAVVDADGNPTGKRTEDGNAYHLIPGKTYTKDPTVTVVKGSEEAYIRMLVTINCYEELCTIFGEPFLPQYFVSGWDSEVWVTTNEIKVDKTANTGTYEFRYYTTVAGDSEDVVLGALFDTVTVPATMTGEQLKTIANLEINVEAHAIQKSGFDTAGAAWAEFSNNMAFLHQD